GWRGRRRPAQRGGARERRGDGMSALGVETTSNGTAASHPAVRDIALAPPPDPVRRFLLNYVHLTAVVVLEFRQWLALLLTLTMFLNLGMIFAFSFIAGSRDPALGQYIVPGSAIMALVTIGVSMVANDLAQQRRTGSILYYASLPISKMAYVLAMVTGNGFAALPGVLVTVLVGSWLYQLPLAFNPVVLLVLPLSAISLAGFGAAIGLGIKNWRVVGMVAQLTMFFIMFFAPVMIPLDRLPGALQITGHILPPTYAARAFRAALQPEITGALMMDVGILALWAIGSLVVVAKTLEWRLD
ncbi:MAG TPA: ABC transporter permease, partial [Chloroflexota bacterium]|nr:ABC transporter permease [Chloroflexota bacterium]